MIELWGQKGGTEETGLGCLICSYHVDTLGEVFGDQFPLPAGENNATLTENFGKRRFEKWWNGGYLVSVVFEGIVNSTIFQYGIYPSFKEAKLLAHPNIDALLTKYGGTPTVDGRIIWKQTLGGATYSGLPGSSFGQNAPINPMYGQDSYVEVSAVFRSERILTAMPEDVLTRLGKIKDHLPSGVDEVTPAERNWIVMPSPCIKRGVLFEDTQEWLLSPPGRKWNEDVYDFIVGVN